VHLMWDGPTDGAGDLAHCIVAHVEVAQALAFDQARRQGLEEVVREGKPGGVSIQNSSATSAGPSNLSISVRMTSMTSSGRRAMFLWPRSMVMPVCCCCTSRGASGPRWLMSWRECEKAAFARATTSSSGMGTGVSLLMAETETGGGQRGGRRLRRVQTCSGSRRLGCRRCGGEGVRSRSVAVTVAVTAAAAAHDYLCKERRIVYLAALVEGRRRRA
jgi:hypothetical protein